MLRRDTQALALAAVLAFCAMAIVAMCGRPDPAPVAVDVDVPPAEVQVVPADPAEVTVDVDVPAAQVQVIPADPVQVTVESVVGPQGPAGPRGERGESGEQTIVIEAVNLTVVMPTPEPTATPEPTPEPTPTPTPVAGTDMCAPDGNTEDAGWVARVRLLTAAGETVTCDGQAVCGSVSGWSSLPAKHEWYQACGGALAYAAWADAGYPPTPE